MTIHVLILGGTTEARQLAGLLAEDARYSVILSLAGRTRNPAPQPVPVRTGGFGGASGLAAYLKQEGTNLLVDATHPFAARISANACAAGRTAGVPLIVLRRPAWEIVDDDRWSEVDSVEAAVCALGKTPKRVFVTLGRQELRPLQSAPQHTYLVRSVDPIDPPLDLPDAHYRLERGPFNEDDELALMRRKRIEVVLAKNSGGAATYGKIAAARRLAIPVVMVRRPDAPAARAARNAGEAAEMIAGHVASFLDERGE
ncbi:cobalt-precorrin-6A reductase [Mesorhizobium xinjiangense]|uniref:cobalt-precorrin-6A reductase n=1 Tax=Mesorhizobium xinjiangense TaxID=2678685 RepID=UPI0012EECAC4|nr:cobalt-precorrin-6A reductase [Mesorhizobium xinjiangense]